MIGGKLKSVFFTITIPIRFSVYDPSRVCIARTPRCIISTNAKWSFTIISINISNNTQIVIAFFSHLIYIITEVPSGCAMTYLVNNCISYIIQGLITLVCSCNRTVVCFPHIISVVRAKSDVLCRTGVN